MSVRKIFVVSATSALALSVAVPWLAGARGAVLLALPLIVAMPVLLGLYDMVQTQHTIRRNFPIIGRLRYLFESVRPELQQYFVESNSSGRPFSRDLRSLIYQRAKNQTDTVPFGTEKDVYAVGYEWINHSLTAVHPPDEPPRITIGGPACTRPYRASVLNVSAMSYGSLSRNAILALNQGAKRGGFAHNTGEAASRRIISRAAVTSSGKLARATLGVATPRETLKSRVSSSALRTRP